jgi:ubiquinone/menaquinone biosynthesis C-methylase UbiE
MTASESNLDRTYDSLSEEDAVTLLNDHYGEGIDGYKFWAELPTAIKALWLGIENVPEHPAQLHYAWLNNEDGTPNKLNLNEGIHFATTRAIELLKLNDDEPITLLDVGCGVGGAVLQIDLFLQEQQVEAFQVHGISIVSKQIKAARLRCRNLGAINSQSIVGNFLNLPYASNYFKGIIALETLCHVPPEDKLNLLQGLFRVLTPGGRIVIFDGYLSRKPETSAERDRFRVFRNGWTLPQMVTPDEMNDVARKSGFDIETSFDALSQVRPSVDLIDRRARIIGMSLLRIYRLLKKLGHESKLLQRTGVHTPNAEACFQACFAQKELVDSGLLTYHAHVLRRPPSDARHSGPDNSDA